MPWESFTIWYISINIIKCSMMRFTVLRVFQFHGNCIHMITITIHTSIHPNNSQHKARKHDVFTFLVLPFCFKHYFAGI